MGRDTVADASRALRLLNSPAFRQYPDTGPTERRAASATPGIPLNIGTVDYLAQAFGEVVDHVQAVTVEPRPLPERIEDLYVWYFEATDDADEAARAHRDTLVEKHRLEHAVRLGEYDVVCKEPCPRCGCWGLMWEPAGGRALCSNRRCRTPDGLSSSWTLGRLAGQKIQRTEIWRRNAT